MIIIDINFIDTLPEEDKKIKYNKMIVVSPKIVR